MSVTQTPGRGLAWRYGDGLLAGSDILPSPAQPKPAAPPPARGHSYQVWEGAGGFSLLDRSCPCHSE